MTPPASRNPRFSVVVPFHNSVRYIRACVEHLLGQDYDPQQFEVILVDNGSTDGSAAVVREFPRVRLLSEPQPGSYAARNRALPEARGSWVAFTDADCAPHPRWLSSFDQAFQDPGVKLVLGQRRPHRETPLVASLADYENCKVAYICQLQDPYLYYGYTGNMAVRRELLDRYGPFEKRARGADTIFVRRVVDGESGSVVRHCPEAVVRHLELDSARVYWRKTHTYGYSMQLCGRIIRRRDFSLAERIAAFLRSARSGRYPLWRQGLLLGALAWGFVTWNLGRLAASWAGEPGVRKT